ncbi:MAG: peptidyl-prolyl cis-trans isomerase [Methanomassiliicoccaceae archaeon]|nr:peptidyl-prolyl cis-trans isomerase [Methanomassiliicoccaceae archaeon]
MAKQVNAAHILVETEKKASEIKERVLGGETFADMAKKYSKCPSGGKGGELGWFGRGQMVKEFENAAFAAGKGAVVGPVRTEFGWHLILIKDVKG